MGFFNSGNIITLVIIVLGFALYKLVNKNDRHIMLAKKQGEKLKEELKDELYKFVEERRKAIDDTAVIVDSNDRKSKILLDAVNSKIENLQNHIDTINNIDEKLDVYQKAVEALFSMTERVEENLDNIEAESKFVENTSAKLDLVKTKIDEIQANANAMQDHIKEESVLAAQEIEKKVDEYRAFINLSETERKTKIESDMQAINNLLRRAGDNASEQAGTFEAELLETLQSDAKKRFGDATKLIMDSIDKLKANIADTERNQNDQSQKWQEQSKTITHTLDELNEKSELTVSGLFEKLQTLAEDIGNKSLQEADAKLQEYRDAQAKQFESYEKLAHDAISLDSELRKHLHDISEASKQEFTSNIDKIKSDITKINSEIEAIKTVSLERIGENLKTFETDFSTDLEKRQEFFDNQLASWKVDASEKLKSATDNIETESKKMEKKIIDSLNRKKIDLDNKLDNEIEFIKNQAAEIEKNVHSQINRAADSVKVLQDQLQISLSEMREEAENSFKSEAARLALQNIEKVKTVGQEMESSLASAQHQIKAKYEEINAQSEASMKSIIEYKNNASDLIKEITSSIEDVRRANKEITASNEQQIALVSSKIEDFNETVNQYRNELLQTGLEKFKTLEEKILSADDQIKNFIDQTKLIEKTEEMKTTLNRRIDDLITEMEKVELKSTELVSIETQIAKIKRIEDELNAKMSGFVLEQSRIERMEADFKKLLAISSDVDDKLESVRSKDESLEEMQMLLRRLNDTMKKTEERFTTLEKKNEMLDETNLSISRNFKNLQEAEKSSGDIKADLQRITAGFNELRDNIEKLSGENEKANEALQRITTLDETLTNIDKHIKKVEEMRAWYANLETRINEQTNKVRTHVKTVDTILGSEGKKTKFSEDAGIPLGMHEEVIQLKNSGWSEKEIAKNLKISVAAVQLILENADR